jgi:ABC-type dipeptide/oligopeptide/nickel transport system permease subunit
MRAITPNRAEDLLRQEYQDPTWRDHLGGIWKRLRRDRIGMFGLVIVLTLAFTAIFADQIAPHAPLQQNLRSAKQPPAWTAEGSWDHPLGTDNLGRDMFSRIVYGSRVSLTVGLFGVLIAGTLGLAAGLLAGYLGGWVDAVVTGIINLFLAIPYVILVVVAAAVLGRSLFNVILLFGITGSPIFARLARGEVLRLRGEGYVESARSIGADSPRILLRHILPNLVGPMVTLATFEMSAMIFYEAGLSFLGLSVPPSVPSWGNMLSQGRQYLNIYPWIAVYPGVAIAITALGMNLLGDWLRDMLDPRTKQR